jgi:hypothetical protein
MLTPKYPTRPPSPNEINTAILHISSALRQLGLHYGLIGPAALQQYASVYSLPMDTPTSISLVLQPSPRITSSLICKILCSQKKHFYVRKNGNGIKVRVVRLPAGGNNVVWVDVDIYDHYVYPWRRETYDLRLQENWTETYQIVKSNVVYPISLLNLGWLLKEKISTYSEDKSEKEERDIQDVLTLCEVLKRENQCLRIRGWKGREELRAFMQEFCLRHDWRILKGVIDCPEVLGPWYLRTDVKWTALVIAVLVTPVVLDYFTSV